jgi:hypothetical protein
LVFGTRTERLLEDDAHWILTSWGDRNLAFIQSVAPKLKAAIEPKFK